MQIKNNKFVNSFVANKHNKISKYENLNINKIWHNSAESSMKICEILELPLNSKVNFIGRITNLRLGNMFINLIDSTGFIQCMINDKNLFEVRKLLDKDDICKINGVLILNNYDKKIINISKIKIISTSLLPVTKLGNKIGSHESKYLTRTNEFITNRLLFYKLKLKFLLINEIKNIYIKKGFIEVKTPILETIPGGAIAKPFSTHFNSLNKEMFLRIAPELSLKRLLVIGFDNIFEIGEVFRNEGIGKNHYPEFTILESYSKTLSFNKTMLLVEEIIDEKCKFILNFYNSIYKEISEISMVNSEMKKELDQNIKFIKQLINSKWEYFYFNDLILKAEKEKKITVNNSIENAISLCNAYNFKINLENKLTLHQILEDLITKVLLKDYPKVHLIGHPNSLSPLAESDRNGNSIRFESFINNVEIAHGYEELSDPILQENLLQNQKTFYEEGIAISKYIPLEFLHDLKIGFGNAVGLGLGLTRIWSILLSSKNIKELNPFIFHNL